MVLDYTTLIYRRSRKYSSSCLRVSNTRLFSVTPVIQRSKAKRTSPFMESDLAGHTDGHTESCIRLHISNRLDSLRKVPREIDNVQRKRLNWNQYCLTFAIFYLLSLLRTIRCKHHYFASSHQPFTAIHIGL